VKKAEQTKQKERLKGSSSKSSTEVYVGDNGINCVHMQDDLV
jgi:hypothetical protein